MNMEEIVALSVKHNVSDLHLCSAWPARWRIRGRMEAAPFDTPDVEELLREWLDDDQRAILLENGQLDFAVSLAENQRLRGSAFAQRHGISLALRLLPSHCPQLEQLGAPTVLPELLKSENGLILVTGATGSGKSTTLAAMVGYLNQHADAHILTLEDPVEYLYASQRCLIQQREIGLHCMTFASGLRAALREDPDVILLGELRDSETIRLALTAAETGHLVLATLHTRGAAQAVERLVAEHFDWCHTIDRLRIATRLNDQRPAELPPLNVLIQINISDENSKSGIQLAELDELAAAVAELPRLRLRGLMAIPAPESEYVRQFEVARQMAVAFAGLKTRYPHIDTLSLGMSDDMEAAIAAGSTMVRIGTAIFGARDYSKK
jgi:twitching motility protein PilT